MKTTDEIIEAFPALLKPGGRPIFFECGHGWHDLLYDLCKKITEIIKREALVDVYAVQIKEKYGTLRFYMSTETDQISDLIEQYQTLSGEICETCGAPGTLRGKGWLRTACEEH